MSLGSMVNLLPLWVLPLWIQIPQIEKTFESVLNMYRHTFFLPLFPKQSRARNKVT